MYTTGDDTPAWLGDVYGAGRPVSGGSRVNPSRFMPAFRGGMTGCEQGRSGHQGADAAVPFGKFLFHQVFWD